MNDNGIGIRKKNIYINKNLIKNTLSGAII